MTAELDNKITVTPDGRIRQTDAPEYLGVAYETICEWGRERKFGLKPIKVGRRIFYDFEQIKKIANGIVNDDGTLINEAKRRGQMQ